MINKIKKIINNYKMIKKRDCLTLNLNYNNNKIKR